MVLRIAAFLCLVALAASQTADVPTTMEPVQATTGEPVVNPPEMSTTMEPAPTTEMPTTEMPTEVPDLDERYERSQAVEMRARHFYCLGPNDVMFDDDIVMTSADSTETNTDYRVWALFLQYPILNYLDTMGKEMLLRITARLVQNSNNDNLETFNETDFCIGRIVHYGVSTYEESILINFYFRGDTVVNGEGAAQVGRVSITEFDAAFQSAFMAAAADQSSDLVQRFLGRNAYIINLPGASAVGLDANEDPTQRAVVLGSFVGNTTIETARNGMMQEFAENPDPLNFGLEAGDIIFAVFGSIFLTIVGGLVLLGFCIHPFFLA